MNLRPYQLECKAAVVEQFRLFMTLLVVMPTGTGKSVTLASLVAIARKGRVLVIAHREELVNQLAATLRHMTQEEVGVEMADRFADGNIYRKPRIVVASIQTLTASGCRRLEQLIDDPNEWSLTVIDEAHHAPANSYRLMVEHMQKNPEHKVLGVTATPDRTDALAMGSVFEEVAYEYRIDEAIHDGWLVPIKQRSVRVESLNYEDVRTTAGDLNGADLSKVMEQERNLHAIATPTYEIAGDRKAVVFCASVAQAERLAEILNRHEAGCARFVFGGTPKPDRRRLFKDFDAGRFRFLCNCMIATEGWDCPTVDMVVIGRPTKSRSLFAQMVGRGLRPLPGLVDSPASSDSPGVRKSLIFESAKPFCEVLDFVGASGRHKLITTADILGGDMPDPVVRRANEIVEESDDGLDIEEALAQAEDDIRAEEEEEKKKQEARRAKIKADAKYTTKVFSPFNLLDVAPPPTRACGPSTDKQCKLLQKFGIDATDMSKDEASKLQREVFRRMKAGLCTPKQAKWLAKYGYDTNITKQEASVILDSIFAREAR